MSLQCRERETDDVSKQIIVFRIKTPNNSVRRNPEKRPDKKRTMIPPPPLHSTPLEGTRPKAKQIISLTFWRPKSFSEIIPIPPFISDFGGGLKGLWTAPYRGRGGGVGDMILKKPTKAPEKSHRKGVAGSRVSRRLPCVRYAVTRRPPFKGCRRSRSPASARGPCKKTPHQSLKHSFKIFFWNPMENYVKMLEHTLISVFDVTESKE